MDNVEKLFLPSYPLINTIVMIVSQLSDIEWNDSENNEKCCWQQHTGRISVYTVELKPPVCEIVTRWLVSISSLTPTINSQHL